MAEHFEGRGARACWRVCQVQHRGNGIVRKLADLCVTSQRQTTCDCSPHVNAASACSRHRGIATVASARAIVCARDGPRPWRCLRHWTARGL